MDVAITVKAEIWVDVFIKMAKADLEVHVYVDEVNLH